MKSEEPEIRELRNYLVDALVKILQEITPQINENQLRAIAVSFDNKIYEQFDNLDQYIFAFEQKFQSYGRSTPNLDHLLFKISNNQDSQFFNYSPQHFDTWDNEVLDFLQQLDNPEYNHDIQ